MTLHLWANRDQHHEAMVEEEEGYKALNKPFWLIYCNSFMDRLESILGGKKIVAPNKGLANRLLDSQRSNEHQYMKVLDYELLIDYRPFSLDRFMDPSKFELEKPFDTLLDIYMATSTKEFKNMPHRCQSLVRHDAWQRFAGPNAKLFPNVSETPIVSLPYEGQSVDSKLGSISVQDAYEIVKSISLSKVGSLEHRRNAKHLVSKVRELYRQLRCLNRAHITNFDDLEISTFIHERLDLLQQFIYEVYHTYDKRCCIHLKMPLFDHFVFDYNPEIVLQDTDSEMWSFFSRIEYDEGELVKSNFNSFYYFIRDNFKKSRTLYSTKLRRMVKNNLNRPLDEVLKMISDLLVIPAVTAYECMSHAHLNSIQWAVQFLNPYFFFVDLESATLWYIFRNVLKELRRRILRFCYNYYFYKTSSSRVQNLMSDYMHQLHSDFMRSWEGQQLILQYGDEDAKNIAYDLNVRKFKNACVSIAKQHISRRYELTLKTRNRSQQRDVKYFHNIGEFMPHSKVVRESEKYQAMLDDSDSDSDNSYVSFENEPELSFINRVYNYIVECGYSIVVSINEIPENVSTVVRRSPPYSTSWYNLFGDIYEWTLFQTYSTCTKLYSFWSGVTDPLVIVSKGLQVVKHMKHTFTPVNGRYSDTARLYILEMYNAINGLVDIYSGNYRTGTRWLSGILLVHIDDVANVIGVPDMTELCTWLRSLVSKEYTYINFNGQSVPVNNQFLREMVKEYNETGRVVYKPVNHEHVKQSLTDIANPLISVISDQLSVRKLATLEPWEVTQMNQQFLFMNHESRRLSSQMTLVTKILSMITRYFFLYDAMDTDYMVFTSKLVDNAKFITSTFTRDRDLANDKSLCEEVIRRKEEAEYLLFHPMMAIISTRIASNYSMLYNKLLIMAKAARNHRRGLATRDPPLCICFTGKPKTGKSYATGNIFRYLYKRWHDKDLEKGDIYTLPSDPKYMDGYNNQFGVMGDDIFKSTIQQERADEGKHVIEMVNDAPYNMNMSDTTDKGQFYFDSEVLILSSNKFNDGLDHAALGNGSIGLTDPEAFTRRLHIVIHAVNTIDEQNPPKLEDMEFELHRNAFGKPIEKINGQYPKYKFFDLCAIIDLARNKQLSVRAKHVITDGEFERKMKNYDYRPEIYDQAMELDICHPLVLDKRVNEVPRVVTQEFVSNGLQQSKNKIDDIQQLDAFDYIGNVLDSGLITMSIDYENYLIPFFYFAVTTTTIGIAGYTLYSWFSPSDKKAEAFGFDFDLQSAPTRGVKGKNTRNVAKTNRVVKSGSNYRGQSKEIRQVISDSLIPRIQYQTYYDTREKIMSSMVKVGASGESEGVKVTSTCLGYHLENGYYMVPCHFYLPLMDLDNVILGVRGQNFCVTVDLPMDFHYFDRSDLLVFKLDAKVDNPPFGIKHMITGIENTLEDGCFLELLTMNSLQVSPYAKKASCIPGQGSIVFGCEEGDESYFVETPLRYKLSPLSVEGDSGGLIVSISHKGTCIIVGMHCGAHVDRGYGFCMPISQVIIKELMPDKYKPQSSVQYLTECPLVPSDTVAIPCHLNTSSKIRRAIFEDWYGPPVKLPVKLYKHDGMVPVFEAMRKLRQEHFDMPVDAIAPGVIDYLFSFYPKIVDTNFKRILTPQEAVSWEYTLNGKTSTNSVVMSTCSGYFLPNIKGFTGKHAFLEYVNNRPALKRQYEPLIQGIFEALVERQVKPNVLWSVCLKMERRSKEVPRLFSACPLHALLIYRMLFLPIVIYIMSRCATCPVKVGINPHSTEWTMLYNDLKRYCKSIISGDYSNYDGTIPKNVGIVVVNFINKWYDDDIKYQRARELMFEHIYSAQYVYEDKVYDVKDGNPSGNPLTSIYNSLCNIVILYSVLYDLVPIHELIMAVYGDDAVVAVNRLGLKVEDLAKPIKEKFGMTFTHWTKEKVEDREQDTLENINFLSRGFVKNSYGIVNAPLPLTTIAHSTYWYKKQANIPLDVIVIGTARSFFIELSHYPGDVYRAIADKYLLALAEEHPHLVDTIRRFDLGVDQYRNQMYRFGTVLLEYSFHNEY